MKVTEFFLGFGPKLWSFQRGETEYGIKAIPPAPTCASSGCTTSTRCRPRTSPAPTASRATRSALAVAVGRLDDALPAGDRRHLPGVRHRRRARRPPVHPARTTSAINERRSTARRAAAGRPRSRATASSSIDGEQIDSFDKLHDVVAPRHGPAGRRSSSAATASRSRKARHHRRERRPRASSASSRRPPPNAAGRPGHRGRAARSPRSGTSSKRDVRRLRVVLLTVGPVATSPDTVVQRRRARRPAAATNRRRASTSAPSSSTVDENRPVSIIGAARFGSEIVGEGAFAFLAFFASINIVIGIFNLIPLLPLDGGHVAIATYERIRSRKGRRYLADVDEAAAAHLRGGDGARRARRRRRSSSTSSIRSIDCN